MDKPSPEGQWTRERVEHRLIAAFRAMPSCPIYTAGPRVIATSDDENTVTAALAWAGYLDGDRDARTYLWAWARCQAMRTSFSELVDGKGWKRSTVEAARRRAAVTIALRLSSAT